MTCSLFEHVELLSTSALEQTLSQPWRCLVLVFGVESEMAAAQATLLQAASLVLTPAQLVLTPAQTALPADTDTGSTARVDTNIPTEAALAAKVQTRGTDRRKEAVLFLLTAKEEPPL